MIQLRLPHTKQISEHGKHGLLFHANSNERNKSLVNTDEQIADVPNDDFVGHSRALKRLPE